MERSISFTSAMNLLGKGEQLLCHTLWWQMVFVDMCAKYIGKGFVALCDEEGRGGDGGYDELATSFI